MFLQSVIRRVLKPYQQFGALPFRWSDNGSLKVMLRDDARAQALDDPQGLARPRP